MNFQPMDYLNGLDFDFELSPSVPEVNDLDIFAQSEFFDLDVFAHDSADVSKHQQRVQYQQTGSVQVQPQVEVEFQQQQEFKDALPLKQLIGDVSSSPGSYTPQAHSSASDEIERSSHDDKRKRNTAASARFRIKKKQKEQEMEARAKQLQENVAALEKKLKTLEMENKCLKTLILQQNERKDSDLLNNIKKRSIEHPVFQFTT